jgi:hypothetical protein
MSLSRKINKTKRGLRKAPVSDLRGDPKPTEHATMHESDISEFVPEPQGSGEALEESWRNY